jgi:hypothetical protein
MTTPKRVRANGTTAFGCDAVISRRGHITTCERDAVIHLEKDGTCVRHFCRQHASRQGRNPAGLSAWEFDTVTDDRRKPLPATPDRAAALAGFCE